MPQTQPTETTQPSQPSTVGGVPFASFRNEVHFRQTIFDLPIGETLYITMEDYNKYWEYATNMFIHSNGKYMGKKVTTMYLDCRLSNAKHTKKRSQEDGQENAGNGQGSNAPVKRKRRKQSNVEGLCKTRLIVRIKLHPVHGQVITVVHRNGSQPHSHPIEHEDMRKIVAPVKEKIDSLAKLGLPPRHVIEALHNMEDMNPEFLTHVTTTHAANSRKKVFLGPRGTRIATMPASEDLDEGCSWLRENGYMYKQFTNASEQRISLGIAFMSAKHAEYLSRFGSIVLMDSTHTTNGSGFKLFTLYLRSHAGTWLPGAHFYAENETIEMISEGLRSVRQMMESIFKKRWEPRYFVIDQSPAEEGAILDAFPGMPAGEQEVSIYYCRVHLMRTLNRHIKGTDSVYGYMVQALHAYTRPRCIEFLDKAITRCTSTKTKKYLERYWQPFPERWGMFARQHSTLLLQMDTTNALESYHRDIKRKMTTRDSFKTSFTELDRVFKTKVAKEDRQVRDLASKQVPECDDYPVLAKFSFVFQQLMSDEIAGAFGMIEQGPGKFEMFTLAEPACECNFFRKWFLPCRHMFYLDIMDPEGWFNDAIWNSFVDYYQEGGYEVYEARERVVIEAAPAPSVDTDRLRFNTEINELTNVFWRIQEENDIHKMSRLQAMLQKFSESCQNEFFPRE